jgi:hypothetical protein
MSLTGRGRPRRLAAADRTPQIAATASSPGRTGMPVSQPAGQFPAAVGTPAADFGPLGQLTERDEGDERFAADQARGQRPGKFAPVQ